eukprot:3167359-Prymnesium_polylepis.1
MTCCYASNKHDKHEHATSGNGGMSGDVPAVRGSGRLLCQSTSFWKRLPPHRTTRISARGSR